MHISLGSQVRLTKSTQRQASIREKTGPSLGKMQVKIPHQRSPCAMKYEDRSPGETARQERCARGKAWNLAKNMYKLKEKEKAAFHSPSEEWVMPAASTIKPEEREFAVDSGVHMVSNRDLKSAELETMRISKNPTTVMTASGEVQTKEEATVFFKEIDSLVNIMLLEETPRIMVQLPLDQWSKTTSRQERQKHRLQYIKLRTICGPWSIDESLYFIFICFFNIFTAGYCGQHGESSNSKSHGETRRMDQQKPKTPIKMKMTRKYPAICCKICWCGYRISRRIWWVRMLNHINTLQVLLTNYQWSREQKWCPARVSTACILIFPERPKL